MDTERILAHSITVVLVSLANLMLISAVHAVESADYTWIGGGDTSVWNDPDNWTGGPVGGYPGAADDDTATPGTQVGADGAIFPDGVGTVTITSGFSSDGFNLLQTGNGALTLPAQWNPKREGESGLGTGRRNASIDIGTGGITFTTGGIDVNGMATVLRFAGNTTMDTLNVDANMPNQTGGTMDINELQLPWNQAQGPYSIPAYHFIDSGNLTITTVHNLATADFPFTGTPTFDGGRPDWRLVDSGGTTGDNSEFDLGTHTLYGDELWLDGNQGFEVSGAILTSTTGGVVDINSIHIGLGGLSQARNSHLDLHDSTVLVGGTGTVWENDSTNSTSFSLTDNTTVSFNPNGAGAGSATVDTGSTDSGLGGFTDNFAFGHVTVGTGDTVTLTGNDNTATPGDNALYVNGDLGLGDGSTLAMDGRNAYLNGQLSVGDSPGMATISGGDFSMTSNASFVVEIEGLNPGTEYDQLVITGAGSDIAIAGTLEPVFSGFTPVLEDAVFIISNESGNTTGTFDGLPDDSPIGSYLGMGWNITYDADFATLALDGGNDVALYAIPEPASLLVLVLAGLAALRRARRA